MEPYFSCLIVTIVLFVLFLSGQSSESTSHSSTSHSSTRHSHDQFECDDIGSFSSKIRGELYIKDIDGESYEEARSQFASIAFAENVMPSIIVVPKHDNDIKRTILFATQCGYKIVTRSGGHQYSGLSSCNSNINQCIQIDMKNYNDIKQRKEQLIVGTGVELHDLSPYLVANQLFLPHGQGSHIGVGGHIQTGGQGLIHNQFGYLLDHVRGFNIFLSDGKKHRVMKPGTNFQVNILNTKTDGHVTDELNDKLYYAVLGGNPGSFGVISKWHLVALKDADYVTETPVFYQCAWPYIGGPIMTALLNVMKEIYSETQDFNAINTDYTFYVRPLKTPQFSIILWYGNFMSTSGEPLNQEYFDRFINAANGILGDNAIECNPIQLPPSQYMSDIGSSFEGISTYRTRMQATTQPLSDDFIQQYVNRMNILFNPNDDEYNGIYIYSDVVPIGGNYINADSLEERTSIPRAPHIQINTDVYYILSINQNAESVVEEWMDESWTAWLNTPTYDDPDNDGSIDIRAFGTTFGNLNIEDVWEHYYVDSDGETSQKLYDDLREIKKLVDPNDLFSNSMTLNSL